MLKKYLKTENSLKSVVSQAMTFDPEYWYNRPLTQEMIKYAAEDVVYLPKAFYQFSKLLDVDLMMRIFEKSQKCQYYSLVNKFNTGISNLKQGEFLGAYLK
jgi:ribonuclease D